MFRSPSLLIGILLCIAIVFFRFLYPPVNILTWDVFGYYLYLPALFINNDLGLHDLNWVNELVERYHVSDTLYQLYKAGDGWVIKYSMGMAILNLPAFLIGYLCSLALGYPTDGFSLPFQYAYAISGLIYAVMGVLMLRRILLTYFSELISSIVLVIVVLGTNYFQLTAFDGMLSHNYLFTLYTFIVWFTIRWHARPKTSTALGLGLALGLAILSRPSELVCLIIPLLWNIYNRESLAIKWKLLKKNWTHFVIIAGMIMLAGLPQLIYWKSVTGQWFYYSYNNPGEGFDFLSPYISQVLFSFRKGWLIYTPVMAFALAGFIFVWREQKGVFPALMIYFLVNLWIVSSWTCWWYAGGSYSQRALLSSYVLLAIPMGYMLDAIMQQKKLIRWFFLLALLLLVILNIFQTWQWTHEIIDKTRMTRDYYIAVFGKTRIDQEDRKLLLIDRSGKESIPGDKSGLTHKQLTHRDYEKDNSRLLLSDTAFSGKHALRVVPSSPFVPGYESLFRDLTGQGYAWIRVSLSVYPLVPVSESPASLVASFEHKGQTYKYKAESLGKEEYHIMPGRWNRMGFDYLTPEVRSKEDILKVYFWLQGNTPILVDDFKVEMWEPLVK